MAPSVLESRRAGEGGRPWEGSIQVLVACNTWLLPSQFMDACVLFTGALHSLLCLPPALGTSWAIWWRVMLSMGQLLFSIAEVRCCWRPEGKESSFQETHSVPVLAKGFVLFLTRLYRWPPLKSHVHQRWCSEAWCTDVVSVTSCWKLCFAQWSAVIIVRTLEKLLVSQAGPLDNGDRIALGLFCLCLCSPLMKQDEWYLPTSKGCDKDESIWRWRICDALISKNIDDLWKQNKKKFIDTYAVFGRCM